ncbi:MAG: hypothetical protein KatS3mg006_2286 [Pyrinomonadaceae bacterium]|nr:MAG: hypothetical protein KatS3mg006_2286 [Pyrinomonadaceae bacterium]
MAVQQRELSLILCRSHQIQIFPMLYPMEQTLSLEQETRQSIFIRQAEIEVTVIVLQKCP